MLKIGVIGEVSQSKQFEWKIPDFLSLSTERNSYYDSPSFVFDNTSLHLKIFPGGQNRSKSGSISLFLENEYDTPLDIFHTLLIKKADGTLIGGGSSGITLGPFEARGCQNFYHRSDLEQNKSELLPSGTLTIISILKLNQDGKQGTVKAENLQEEQTLPNSTLDYQSFIGLDVLSENLRSLSTNKDSCDVVLEVEDKEFNAHKAILMARSPVFAAMFQHDTLEKQTGIIKIPDCDSESFNEFLGYLYCGKLQDVSFRSAFHLYSTAYKYDIENLKEFCTEYLIQSLSVDNVCDVVKLADKYDETKLITKVQDFFSANMSRIFLTTEWASLITNNPRIANKLLVEFAKTKGSK